MPRNSHKKSQACAWLNAPSCIAYRLDSCDWDSGWAACVPPFEAVLPIADCELI